MNYSHCILFLSAFCWNCNSYQFCCQLAMNSKWESHNILFLCSSIFSTVGILSALRNSDHTRAVLQSDHCSQCQLGGGHRCSTLMSARNWSLKNVYLYSINGQSRWNCSVNGGWWASSEEIRGFAGSDHARHRYWNILYVCYYLNTRNITALCSEMSVQGLIQFAFWQNWQLKIHVD